MKMRSRERIPTGRRGQRLFSADTPFLMDGLHAAPFAELRIFDLALHLLLVLVRIVITPLARGATERNETVGSLNFCHEEYSTMACGKRQPSEKSPGATLCMMSRWPDLNRRPTPYHGVALPTELHRRSLPLYCKSFTQKVQTRRSAEPPPGIEPGTFALQKRCSTS